METKKSMIETVAELKELEKMASAPDWYYRETSLTKRVDPKYFSNMRVGSTTDDRVFLADAGEQPDLDLVVALRNAAPKLLDALDFRAGDAEILHWMLTGEGDDPAQEEINDILHRYHDMAAKMGASCTEH